MGWILGLGNGVVFRTGSSTAWSSYFNAYKTWVLSEGGSIIDETYTKNEFRRLVVNNEYASLVRYYNINAGVKLRVDGETTYVVALYDMSPNKGILNNLVEANQPKYDSGAIRFYDNAAAITSWLQEMGYKYTSGVPFNVKFEMKNAIQSTNRTILGFAFPNQKGFKIADRGSLNRMRIVTYDGLGGIDVNDSEEGFYDPSQFVEYSVQLNGDGSVTNKFIKNNILVTEDANTITFAGESYAPFKVGAHSTNTGGANAGGGYGWDGWIKKIQINNTFLPLTTITHIISDATVYQDTSTPSQDSATAFNNPIAIFSFDDGRVEEYTVVKPIFDAAGVRCTFALIGKNIGTAMYLSVAQIIEMQNLGYDFQCHSWSHSNPPLLVNMSEAEVRAEMIKNNTVFVSNKITRPIIGIPPYSATNIELRNIMKDYRVAIRGSSNELGWDNLLLDSAENSFYILKNSNILRMQDTADLGITVANVARYKRWIDIVVAQKAAINIIDHGYLLEAEALTELVAYCIAQGMEVMTLKGFYYKYGKYVTGVTEGIAGSIADRPA
jgi:peptidoglycan/xylan/chitin deacetylase (PgdA/CDA1 family)